MNRFNPKQKYLIPPEEIFDLKPLRKYELIFEILGSSGNNNMDKAVTEALKITSISELPPDGMPKAMRLEITSQG